MKKTRTEQLQETVILINPCTQGMVVIDGVSSLDSVLRDLGGKDGQPSASKATIEAMPRVEIGEEGVECVICLEEFEVGGDAKEMHCKNKCHGDFTEKWLEIHGYCPVCKIRCLLMRKSWVRTGMKKKERGGEERSGLAFHPTVVGDVSM